MSRAYQEIIEGETLLRPAPGERHELICARLHAAVRAALGDAAPARLLPPRDLAQLTPGTFLRPDLTLVTRATGKPWLVAEVIEAGGQQVDTVLKKELYENCRLPRLWMVDVRYDNVEVYGCGPHGMALSRILAGAELLQDSLLPGFGLVIQHLFAARP